MYSFLIPILLLVGASGRINAAPADPPGEAFSLLQVRNDNFKPSTGLDAMLRAFAKFNGTLTPQLKVAMQINHNKSSRAGIHGRDGSMWGTVVAAPPSGSDYKYISPIKIGTPPQIITMIIDTGSADFWVMSSDTPKSMVDGQRIYKPDLSSTSRRVNGTWKIVYGDGSRVDGITYTDKVAIGAASFAAQVVESATVVPTTFTDDELVSGLLGLGMSSANTVQPTPALTFMDNIKSSLRMPLFTANLKKGAPGNYNFGYIAKREYNGSIQYTSIEKNSSYWAFTVGGYRVGNSSAEPYKVSPWRAIVDTGTTLLLLPDDIVGAYYARLPGAGFDASLGSLLFPCAAAAPDFTFGLADYRGVVPGRYINHGNVNSTHCFGGIQSSKGIRFSIFGNILLKAQFVVFDLGNKMIGFANKKLEP